MDEDISLVTLIDIHNRVHDGFVYLSDDINHGQSEHWDYPDDVDDFRDDCDGFALACRKLLREQGIANRLVACTVETEGWHLVCVVGQYVLDNRYYRVMTKEELESRGYVFRYISGFEKGEPWEVLKTDNQYSFWR